VKIFFTKCCMSGDMPYVIICKIVSEKIKGFRIYNGSSFGFFPLKWLVTLTTVLRYRAACDFVVNTRG